METPPEPPPTAPSTFDAALLRVGRFADRTRLLTVGGWGLFAASTVLGAALAVPGPADPPARAAVRVPPAPVRTAAVPRQWLAVPDGFDAPPTDPTPPSWKPTDRPPAVAETPAPEPDDPWADLPPAAREDLAAIRDRFGSVADRFPAPPAFPPAPVPATPVPATPAARPAPIDRGPDLSGLRHAAATLRHNLANALTPGFRRAEPLCGASPGGSAPCGVRLDPAPGPLRETGRPLDAAIVGEGWFRLSAPAGTDEPPALTRAGLFGVKDGALVFAPDPRRRVLTAAGDPLAVPADATALRLAADGTLFAATPAGESAVGSLAVVAPIDPAAVTPLGGLLYAADATRPAGEVELRPGHLEGSNVNVETELARLAEVDRLLDLLDAAPPRIAGRE